MGDLVVGDGEGVARGGIEDFAPLLLPDAQTVVLAKMAVDMDGVFDRFDAVFAQDDGANVSIVEIIQ